MQYVVRYKTVAGFNRVMTVEAVDETDAADIFVQQTLLDFSAITQIVSKEEYDFDVMAAMSGRGE